MFPNSLVILLSWAVVYNAIENNFKKFIWIYCFELLIVNKKLTLMRV